MLKAVNSGIIFWRAPRALNVNLPADVEDDLTSALAALRAFRLPGDVLPSSTGATFRSLRLALLAEHCGWYIVGRRNVTSRQDVQRATERLGAATCTSAVDLAMKALAFRALAACPRAYAASRHDQAVLVAEAEALAGFMQHVAADALALAGQAVIL